MFRRWGLNGHWNASNPEQVEVWGDDPAEFRPTFINVAATGWFDPGGGGYVAGMSLNDHYQLAAAYMNIHANAGVKGFYNVDPNSTLLPHTAFTWDDPNLNYHAPHDEPLHYKTRGSKSSAKLAEQGNWVSSAWGWLKDHIYYEAAINVTQGAYGGQIAKFQGTELYAGKHNLGSLSAKRGQSLTFSLKDDDRLWGGVVVFPVGEVPVGIEAANNSTTGKNSGSIGVGDFGVEADSKQVFLGVDKTEGFGVGFIGVDIIFKFGLRWQK